MSIPVGGDMGSWKKRCLLFVLLSLFLIQLIRAANGNVVFEVHHKYGGRSKNKAAAAAAGSLREHDSRRHSRMLASIDLSLGGDGSPTGAALYYTKITIGNPPVDYHVQVDTGSDILWVNCQNCERCPTKTDLNIKLKQYDPSASSTGKLISCEEDFCQVALDVQNSDCKPGNNCEYFVAYGDGSRTEGYFVRDQFRFDQVTGNLQTSTLNGSIAFGCSAKQSGGSGSSSEAVDGLIGFGQANSSILPQLASSGKVKKIFSHCLDGNKGGGIFAIGEVVQPKVNSTALVPNIVDDGFPVVKFHFEGSVTLSVYPHNYLFETRDNEYCIGWQSTVTQTKGGKDMILLGDIVLSDKLVVYDLENQTLGWTEYNCSSSIKVRDEATGNAYDVSAHNISSAFSRSKVNCVIILLFIAAFLKLIEV